MILENKPKIWSDDFFSLNLRSKILECDCHKLRKINFFFKQKVQEISENVFQDVFIYYDTIHFLTKTCCGWNRFQFLVLLLFKKKNQTF
jgi:hypothetical protein